MVPIFSVASSCLTLLWNGPNELVVACNDSTTSRSHRSAEMAQRENTDRLIFRGEILSD
jgi:hypothetical protein